MDLIKRVRIDKAINALDGNASNAAEGYNNNYNFLRLDELRGYRFVAGGQYYLGESICTRAEFEARKAERQNKPSWGEHDYKFIHQGKNGHWYGSLKDNPASLPDIITDECWHYIETASARRGEVFGDYRNTLEQRPNHIGESDEKVSTYAEIQQAAQACERALNEFFYKVKLGESDWYDYDNLIATGYPKPSEIVQAFYGQNDGTGRWVECFVTGLSEHGDLVLETRGSPPGFDKWFTVDCKSKYRPLDFNKVAKHPWHEQGSEPSPELSFHLSNAFNELQASARLLPEDDPRRAQIVALAGGIGAVKEVA